MKAVTKVKALISLGLTNVARVGIYRVGLSTGLSQVKKLKADVPKGPFFRAYTGVTRTLRSTKTWKHDAVYFGFHKVPLADGKPDWFLNPFNGKYFLGTDRPWWAIPDFDPVLGDIKTIWEPSRFDWVLSIAQGIASGETGEAQRLEDWLQDWSDRNPPYQGPNWKCGQEASIRIMHLAIASLIVGDLKSPLPGLRQLLRAHLHRIEPTVGYAIGQDNNHGTSEAAALFIGGTWLDQLDDHDAKRWALLGRQLLENRVKRLIARDGSFSQHSLVYHRVVLDTISIAEIWRRKKQVPEFSNALQKRMAAAAYWLFSMLDGPTGDGPNIGANDGTRLIPLAHTPYRDFRPSVQTAACLFNKKRAYRAESSSSIPLLWLGMALPEAELDPPISKLFDDGGYAVLRHQESMAVLRYPRFKFRPAQSDALHVDLWHNGKNLLRDAGTFSYNADATTLEEFGGTKAHNTVQFDDRNQMPRLGRFLFGEWLTAKNVKFDAEKLQAEAGYLDWRGASHHRKIELSQRQLCVYDTISGSFKKAILRWRLFPGPWTAGCGFVENGFYRLQFTADTWISRAEIVEGKESLYYHQWQKVPILEIEIQGQGNLKSEYFWK